MDYGNVHISPAFRLMVQRKRGQMKHGHEHLRSVEDLRQALRDTRKRYLGSDMSLEMLVREKDAPVEHVVVALSRYLAQRASYFLKMENEDLVFGFFYYGIQLFAYGAIGDESIDDLIQLAKAYERDPEILAILGEEDLPAELAGRYRDWTLEYDQAPEGLTDSVTAAVAVLLGVMSDPITG